jgi:hypothetical protein
VSRTVARGDLQVLSRRRLVLLTIVIGVLFVLLAAVRAATSLLGLPGTWLVIALAAGVDLVELLWRDGGDATFGVWSIAAAIGIAIVAEVVEFAAGAAGAKAGGATRRGTLGAVVGGFLGGLLGTFLIPIPLVGTLIGAALGAGGGALIGEITRDGVTVRDTIKPATGAAAGRIAGTVLKVGFAAVIWLQLSIAAFL